MMRSRSKNNRVDARRGSSHLAAWLRAFSVIVISALNSPSVIAVDHSRPTTIPAAIDRFNDTTEQFAANDNFPHDPIALGLAALGHRLSGSKQGRAAGDIIIEELKNAGLDDVVVQSFPVVQLQLAAGDCVMEHAGTSTPLQPLRPNGSALPVTPPAGITGPIVRIDGGDWTPIDALYGAGQSLRGAIVIMQFNSGDRWLRAVQLGAAAIVFVPGGGPPNLGESKWINANANIPRFLAAADTPLPAAGSVATLRCRMSYVSAEARNIAAFIAPKTTTQPARPAIVLTAAYDTFGPAPFDCPSPRSAMNVAGLIRLGAWLSKNPPAAPIILLFLDNESQDQSGQLAFHFARLRTAKAEEPGSVPRLLAGIEQERSRLAAASTLLQTPAFVETQQRGGGRGWRVWAPTLLINLLTLLALGLAIWVGVDLWAFAGGSAKASWRFWLKAAGVLAACLSLTWAITSFTDRGAGDSTRAPDNAAAWTRDDLSRFVRQQHEDARDRVTELRYERVGLEQAKKRSAEAVAGWAKSADKTGGEVPPDSLIEWQRLSADRLDRRLPAIENELTQLTDAKDNLARVRLDLLNGSIRPDTRPMLERVIAERAGQINQRLAELDSEEHHLKDALALGTKLREAKPGVMVMIDVDPSLMPWYLQTPSNSGLKGVVVNQEIDRWLDKWSAGTLAKSRGAGEFGGKPAGVEVRGRELWGVSSQAMFVITATSLGTPWPAHAMPNEWAGPAIDLDHKWRGIETFVRDLASSDALNKARAPERVSTLFFNVPEWDATAERIAGNLVKRYGGGAVEAETPVPGAVVRIETSGTHAHDVPDFRWGSRLAMSSRDGAFTLLAENDRRVVMTATVTDADGRITGISQLRPGSSLASAADWNRPGSFSAALNNKLCVFDADALVLTGVREDPWAAQPSGAGARLVRGVSDVDFSRFSCSLDGGVAAMYVDRLSEFKLLNGRQLLLNNWLASPMGIGYPKPDAPFDAQSHAASDLWTLNESRLDRLRSHGILDDSLEMLHGKAQEWLERSDSASKQPQVAAAAAVASSAYSGAAYAPIRATADDLVRAVVILLLLAVPFAFAMERLIVASANVYKQIAGFAVFFGLVFGVLYIVHPAFRFAAFPVVVLLAFVIIIMSALVIVIMWSKFEYEVKNMQGIAMASHRSSRNASATLMAAMNQGIASMRRRPLRTTLTAITIVLLTFTTILFGSFSTTRGVGSAYIGPATGGPRVEIQLAGGRQLDAGAAEVLQALWRDKARAYARQWGAVSNAASAKMPVVFSDGHVEAFTAWLSITPSDLAGYPALREALGVTDQLAREMAQPIAFFPRSSQAQPGERVFIDGRTMRAVRSFDPDKLAGVTTISGSRFVPPDVTEMTRLLELQNPGEPEAVKRLLKQLDAQAFPPVDPRGLVVIVDPHMLDTARTGAIVLTPESDADAQSIAREAATMLGEAVVVSSGGRVERLFYGSQLSVGGLSQIIAPLLLGGLIIFGTMLSSVTDREKEVFTLAALGLAPAHVGALFFAEAAVFSLIGGMLGYLLTYLFGKGAELLAEHGLVPALTLNYSSTDSMFAMLLVMATVLLSTIYPAYKASRSANPGIQRAWRIPKPVDDRYDILFPFTVSRHDIVGLISFLEEYMVAHRDRSVGAFAADNVVVGFDKERFTLEARVWLQPFDQGVSQTFRLATRASDIEGIDEVTIELVRASGPPAVWVRSNSVFINDLREQFIFWRTIDENMVEHYHKKTADRFDLTQTQGDDA